MKYLLVIYRDTQLDINKRFETLKELRKYVKEQELKRYSIYELLEEELL